MAAVRQGTGDNRQPRAGRHTLQLYISLARQEGIKQVVSLHVTASGSGAYQAAVAAQARAQARYPDLEIEVIATPRVSLVHGWMVIEAAGAAPRGERLEQMGARMREMIPITHVIHTADTLRYLHKGGRIGRAKRMVGSLLGVKPLIGMEDGVVVALGAARSRAWTHARMVEQAVGRCGRVKEACVHAAAREEAEKIKALVESRLRVARCRALASLRCAFRSRRGGFVLFPGGAGWLTPNRPGQAGAGPLQPVRAHTMARVFRATAPPAREKTARLPSQGPYREIVLPTSAPPSVDHSSLRRQCGLRRGLPCRAGAGNALAVVTQPGDHVLQGAAQGARGEPELAGSFGMADGGVPD